jgi:NhaA family Na+:H+ antiporter
MAALGVISVLGKRIPASLRVFPTALAVIDDLGALGLADIPAYAGRLQMAGTALLCGIGFTMSLFITLLAFPGDPLLQAEAKVGILADSFLSGLLGYALLRVARQDWLATPSRQAQGTASSSR